MEELWAVNYGKPEDGTILTLTLSENTVRRPMAVPEIADLVAGIMETTGKSQREVAAATNISESLISDCLNAQLRLTPGVKQFLTDSKAPRGIWFEISKLPEEKQLDFAAEHAGKTVEEVTRLARQLRRGEKSDRKPLLLRASYRPETAYDDLEAFFTEKLTQLKNLRKQSIPAHMIGKIL